MTPSILLAMCLQAAPANPLAPTVERLSIKYGLDQNVVLAIVQQESSGRMITTDRDGEVFDIGLMQLNIHTAKALRLDPARLMFDPVYNLEAGVRVLATKTKLCRNQIAPWACFHSTHDKRRLAYMLAVARFLKS